MSLRNTFETTLRGTGMIALAALVTMASGLSTAQAEGRSGNRIHEDRFGNLIVQAPGGYKRIVVGRGHLAAQLGGERYRATEDRDPRVVYYGEREDRHERRAYRDDCNRQPVLLHGRSYMYGLDDNVVPVPAGLCR